MKRFVLSVCACVVLGMSVSAQVYNGYCQIAWWDPICWFNTPPNPDGLPTDVEGLDLINPAW